MKELDADKQLACFVGCNNPGFRTECGWRFSGISAFSDSLEDGRCRNVEQGLHSRRISSDNIETYAMIHVFACLPDLRRGQRCSIELRSTLLLR